jgi:hypothetical protein
MGPSSEVTNRREKDALPWGDAQAGPCHKHKFKMGNLYTTQQKDTREWGPCTSKLGYGCQGGELS